MSRIIYGLSAFLAMLSIDDAVAQRPKVGLVLSGGGAKGIAHIGVLKAMEEAGLTPDYVAGTSMGSIVGGMYAAGYSADQLKDIIEKIDWDVLLSNKIAFNEIVFEEKYYANRYLLDFYYDKRKIAFPKGIIEGENLIRLFGQLTQHVHGLGFDELPIPFACVATDIVNGQAVVLRKGSLAMAMRASMSIPSIFTPVRIDGKLLVDGGLIRNMPVNDVIYMGADIVIAVNVSMGLDPEEELSSPISIITQSAFIAAAHEAELEAQRADILIKPDLEDISTGSFNQSSVILKRGDDAGQQFKARFKQLADSLNQLGPPRKVIRPQLPEGYTFSEVRVDGVDDQQLASFVQGRLNIAVNQHVTVKDLEHRFATLYATRYFQRIWYEIAGTPSHRILNVHASANPNVQLRFSYNYDSENKGGIVLNATVRNKLLPRSRAIAEVNLAAFPRVTLDYFKYLGYRQNVAAQITGYFNANELPVINDRGNNEGTFASRSYSATGRLQTTSFLNAAFGIEGILSHLFLKPKIASDVYRDINWIKYNHATVAAYYRLDNTNDRYFPTKGLRAEARFSITPHVNGKILAFDTVRQNADQLGDSFYKDDIYTGLVSIEPFIPISPRLTLLAKARYRKSSLPEGTINLDNNDYIGGFIPTLPNSQEYYGASAKEYLAPSYLYFRTGIQYRILSKIFIGAHYNLLYANHDDDYTSFNGTDFRQAYAASVGYASPIGPIKLFLAKDRTRDRWEASLAIGFYY